MFDPQYRNSITYAQEEWNKQQSGTRPVPQQQAEHHVPKANHGNMISTAAGQLPPAQASLTRERNDKALGHLLLSQP